MTPINSPSAKIGDFSMMIAATADLHLSVRTWLGKRDLMYDAYTALNLVVDAVLANKADVLLIAGDVFDTINPDPLTELAFQTGVSKLTSAGVRVLAVQGNHDRSTLYPRFQLFGAEPLSNEPTVINGVSFCGLDYQPSSNELLEKLAGIPECDVLVMHAPFKHLLGFEGKSQVCLTDIPAHVGCVVVGDIHTWDISNTPDGVPVFSPGATNPRNTAEISSDHLVSFWDSSEKPNVAMKTVDVTPRLFVPVNITDDYDLQNMNTVLEDSSLPLPPAVFLTIASELLPRASDILTEAGIAFVEKRVSDDSEDTMEYINVNEVMTLSGALDAFMPRPTDPKTHDLLEALLNAADPAEELTAMGY
jgi:DNA repair exonuclease SbcCD nuclease subunit